MVHVFELRDGSGFQEPGQLADETFALLVDGACVVLRSVLMVSTQSWWSRITLR